MRAQQATSSGFSELFDRIEKAVCYNEVSAKDDTVLKSCIAEVKAAEDDVTTDALFIAKKNTYLCFAKASSIVVPVDVDAVVRATAESAAAAAKAEADAKLRLEMAQQVQIEALKIAAEMNTAAEKARKSEADEAKRLAAIKAAEQAAASSKAAEEAAKAAKVALDEKTKAYLAELEACRLADQKEAEAKMAKLAYEAYAKADAEARAAAMKKSGEELNLKITGDMSGGMNGGF